MDDCVDRISGLPDPILHHILSFLLTKDAIQITATCKTLNQSWLTHPYLDLGEYFFPFLSGLSDSDVDDDEDDDDDSDDDSDEDEDEDSDEDEDDLEGDILAEHPPIVLADEVAEHPTNVVADEVAEHSTNVVADEGAEHPPNVPNSPKFSIIANEAEHSSAIVDEERRIIIRKREVLFTFVEQTLTRMRMHDITIPKFSLGWIKLDVESIQHLDRWIHSLVQSNINELVLNVHHLHRKPYALPPILLTASSLHSLTLACWKIPSGSLYLWRSLRKLDLERVCVVENFLASIFNTCHDLEEFTLDRCFGLGKRIHIPAKSHLKVFMIGIGDTVNEEVVIEAHHLEKLEYTAGLYPTTINIITNYFGSVSFLKLGGANVTNAWFCDLISRLPCLQELHLSQLNLKAIEISSSSLKRLRLMQVFYYRSIITGEFVINAPNLVELKFIGNLSCVFQNSLAVKKVTIAIADLGISKLEDEELCSKLMQFLQKFDYSEVVTLGPILFEHMIIPVEKRLNLLAPLTHVKHFSLRGLFFKSPINVFSGLLESLLWIAPNLDTLSLKDKKSMEVYPIDLEYMIVPMETRLNSLAPLAHINHLILEGAFHRSPIDDFAELFESLLLIAPNLDNLSVNVELNEVFAIDLRKLIAELTAGRNDCPSLETLERIGPVATAEVCRNLRQFRMATVEEKDSRGDNLCIPSDVKGCNFCKPMIHYGGQCLQ